MKQDTIKRKNAIKGVQQIAGDEAMTHKGFAKLGWEGKRPWTLS